MTENKRAEGIQKQMTKAVDDRWGGDFEVLIETCGW